MVRKYCERGRRVGNGNERDWPLPSVRGGIQGSIEYGKLSMRAQIPRMAACNFLRDSEYFGSLREGSLDSRASLTKRSCGKTEKLDSNFAIWKRPHLQWNNTLPLRAADHTRQHLRSHLSYFDVLVRKTIQKYVQDPRCQFVGCSHEITVEEDDKCW